jgi:hypothetical protein
VDDTDDTKPNDISYVYSGYAPLSIRLVQCITQKNAILSAAAPADTSVEAGSSRDATKGKDLPKAHPIVGWRGFEDSLGQIPGVTFELRQRAEGAGRVDPGR